MVLRILVGYNEMIIESVDKIKGHIVETDGDEEFSYTRYSSDCWFVRMGESDEPVYHCEDIEKLFQKYQKDNS